jgi:hypothetical protein
MFLKHVFRSFSFLNRKNVLNCPGIILLVCTVESYIHVLESSLTCHWYIDGSSMFHYCYRNYLLVGNIKVSGYVAAITSWTGNGRCELFLDFLILFCNRCEKKAGSKFFDEVICTTVKKYSFQCWSAFLQWFYCCFWIINWLLGNAVCVMGQWWTLKNPWFAQ